MASPDCEKRPERQNPAYGRKSSVASKDSDKKGLTRLADAVQNFPFRMLGFGLIYAWSYCVWDVPSLDLASHATPLHGSDLWLASAVITPIACILAAAIGRKRELSDLKPAYALGPALAALGTLCAALLPGLSGPGYSAMLAIAAIATGIGPVVLIVLWTCLFARIDSGLVETIVPASFVATLVCAFLIPNISGIAAVVTVTALPLISGALLKAAKRSVEAGRIEANDPIGGNAGAGNPLNIARAFIIILAVYGIGCLIPYVTQTELPVGIETQATMVGMLFAIAPSIAIVLFSRHIDLSALFRWITAPFVFAAICAAFDNAQLAAPSNVFLNIVFTGIEIIMILYFVRLSQKNQQNRNSLYRHRRMRCLHWRAYRLRVRTDDLRGGTGRKRRRQINLPTGHRRVHPLHPDRSESRRGLVFPAWRNRRASAGVRRRRNNHRSRSGARQRSRLPRDARTRACARVRTVEP